MRLNLHLTKNGLHEVPQSAYRQNHSTETALLKVQNDLLMAIDTYGGAVLILLELSAAFDTIDHTILLQRLHELGIRYAALDWFESYLSQRCYQWHAIITSKFVFRSGSGITIWPNTIHPIHNTAGRNSTEISIFMLMKHSCTWHSSRTMKNQYP